MTEVLTRLAQPRAGVETWERLVASDGGARDGGADLWCTYAGIRALNWAGAGPRDPAAAADYLLAHQNADGGFAWQRGLRSDVWATFYCSQALGDLGRPVPRLDALADWLRSAGSAEGGLAMTPGQAADIWSTYYGVRTWVEVLGRRPPDEVAILAWLARTQRPSGGLSWNESSAACDARASYYGARASSVLRGAGARGPTFDEASLASWLRERQTPDGGFTFGEDHGEPCLWATFRATAALAALESKPRDPGGCLAWIEERRQPDGGYGRWPSYDVSDVWACFSAVGAQRALGAPVAEDAREGVVEFLRACQLPESGFTYREPEAASDALSTAALALLLTGSPPSPERERRLRRLGAWLRMAQMPAEGGVMYMPGRGAEVRCTQWAAAALERSESRSLDRQRLAEWLRGLQNPDGGFGYWEGRGSDLVATVSALEVGWQLGLSSAATPGALRFVRGCVGDRGARFAPGSDEVTLSTTCQAVRALDLLGAGREARALAQVVRSHESALGGFGGAERAIPDLASTYQAVLTLQTLGERWPAESVGRLLRRLRAAPARYRWTPLAREDGGILAGCLGDLLDRAVRTVDRAAPFALPRLNL